MVDTAVQPSLWRGRRLVLSIVLLVVAALLIWGGAELALLGGTLYYLIAGLLVLASAVCFATARSRVGKWLYGAMLAGTLVWTLAEVGANAWQLQARMIAPLVLSAWVYWGFFRRHWIGSLAALVALIGLFAGWLAYENRWQDPAASATFVADGATDWPTYGNTLKGNRFAEVGSITPANVADLEVAWTYRTGSKQDGMGFEATPIMVDGRMYLCTPSNKVIAVDPETGEELWGFDPQTDAPPTGNCRGVAFFRSTAGGQCATRIIFGTVDARLIAIDAVTGKPCEGFGNDGTVDLTIGLGKVQKGYYYVTSSPTIVRGKVVLGGWVLDGQYVGEPSGVIRAFDAETGAFAWAWDMDRPDEAGLPAEGEVFSKGTPNSWGPMSGDEDLGLVYLPVGNSTPDYWGAHRSDASEKFASSIVALDAETGALRWSFQTVHHDVWDYDVSAQPTQVDLEIGGKTVPVVIQATKQGQVFLLDRRTGEPVTRVEERAVAQFPAKGDWNAPTQPFSVGMPSFDDTRWREADMWGLTPLDQLWCRIKFKEARYEGMFTPPNTSPSMTYPSYLGGINWGGVSVDDDRKIMIVNYSRIANYTRLVPRESEEAADAKPSVDGGIHVGQPVPQMGTPFALFTSAFLSPLSVPCTQPPFGKLAAVDLETQEVLWDRPLGTASDSGPMGHGAKIPLPMGVPNSGGSLTTRSGLTFIAATQEKAIRAIETETGRLLWRARLPAGGHASPMTYIGPRDGRQYVVIAAGGNLPLHSGTADHLIAYALPEKQSR